MTIIAKYLLLHCTFRLHNLEFQAAGSLVDIVLLFPSVRNIFLLPFQGSNNPLGSTNHQAILLQERHYAASQQYSH